MRGSNPMPLGLIQIFVGLATALVAAWLVITALLISFMKKGERRPVAVAAFYPNVIRLLRRLYSDPSVSRPVRLRLLVALAYDVQPINLIPDFVPVIGFADNLLVTAWAIRSAVRRSGLEVVSRHWRGSPAELSVLLRMTGLPSDPPGPRPEPEVAD